MAVIKQDYAPTEKELRLWIRQCVTLAIDQFVSDLVTTTLASMPVTTSTSSVGGLNS